MEALEENPVEVPSLEGAKENLVDVSEMHTTHTDEECQQTNGVSRSASEEVCTKSEDNIATEAAGSEPYNPHIDSLEDHQILEVMAHATTESNIISESQYLEIPPVDSVIDGSDLKDEIDSSNVSEIVLESTNYPLESTVSLIETGSVSDSNLDSYSDNVQFETEVVIEKEETIISDINNINENEADTKILSDLDGHNIDLSDALRSESAENNNSSLRQEVFNKEELLDILQGNDVQGTDNEYQIEAEIALNQLSKLKQKRQRRGPRGQAKVVKNKCRKIQGDDSLLTDIKPTPRRRRRTKTGQSANQLVPPILQSTSELAPEEMVVTDELIALEKSKNEELLPETSKKESSEKLTKESLTSDKLLKEKSSEKPKKERLSSEKLKKKNLLRVKSKKQKLPSEELKEKNLVTSLVEDWEDDEPDNEKAKNLLVEGQHILNSSDSTIVRQEGVVMEENAAERTSVDSSANESLNKSNDEGHTRRMGRIIKKKVPFDPDNPDTFTKAKTPVKTKEPQSDKEQPAPKKAKSEQLILRATSKSPVSKSAWKKPTPKSNKQNRRLTEVDKLLMDEGAVNMIYQLTPEASNKNNKKNMRTKAELIKKINQNTPEANEMKFRERKKETPKEAADAKKVPSGKQRASLSGSVKSISVGEDFETHSADDSIIYRRHSSSSYSSTCMSPRRLSDVESAPAQTIAQALQQAAETMKAEDEIENNAIENGVETSDVFMAETANDIPELINKNVCMNIKEKLNSKLSNVLNKRKRESKTDKPMKQKKLTLKSESSKVAPKFKTLSVLFDNRIAEICIRKSESPNDSCGIQVLLELNQALQQIEKTKEVSITLLTSESGSICSSLDLLPLLDANMEKRTNFAFEITEAIRSVLCSMYGHSKVLACGVSAACEGVGLAMVALCDMAVASDRATFALSRHRLSPLVPGIAVLTSHSTLDQALVKELVVVGRQVSAAEALQRGLVSRVLWPDRFLDELRACARDIAAQPAHALLLKKQLLKLSRNPQAEDTFQSRLSSEQDMVAAYWTSVEGQETLQAYLHVA